LPGEDALKRLAGRRVCEQCGAMFHSSFDPPAQPDRCDRCGGRLVQRADDREETVRHRMEVYARETAPVLEHYRAAGLLCEIDGTGSREDVFRRVAASVMVAGILAEVRAHVRPGVATAELDALAEELTLTRGARPAFKGYTVAGRVFPASICISINDEVVHGVPSRKRTLREGDIVG